MTNTWNAAFQATHERRQTFSMDPYRICQILDDFIIVVIKNVIVIVVITVTLSITLMSR